MKKKEEEFLAHISDVHIKFTSKHKEYRQVFERTYEDLIKNKPKRIVLTGDLNHQKITLSPGSIELLSEFLINLVKIAPVDVIVGNHDVNLQQIEQGDTISPIFKIAEKLYDLSNSTHEKKFFIVNKENKDEIDFTKNAVYLYTETEFYNIGSNIVYGVFSCVDKKLLTLSKKEKGKKYIAIYHGGLYGARNDNGYLMQRDSLMKPEVFNNFDMVFLGDLHEYQSFREDESMAYAGSLIQHNFGESINKGYLLWNLKDNSHKRRFVLNDYGYAKVVIAKGEDVEERIENMQFSNNKKKTKVQIVWEDYKENYSEEKNRHIAKLVKDKYGCESVRVTFQEIKRTVTDEFLESEEYKDQDAFLVLLKNYLKENFNEYEDSFIEEVISLAEEIDNALEIREEKRKTVDWELEGVEISNLFSFAEEPVFINFEELFGLIGVFGKNYSGKTNFVRALVWSLYQSVLDSSDTKRIVNIYTKSNKAYTKVYLKINGERYFIYRQVTTKKDKKGEISNSYDIQYKKMVIDEDGNESWVSEISDKKANEKTEVKKLVVETIGDFSDFTKVCLKTQGGKDDYLSQKQQPKNDLINKYFGLEPFRDRYEYGKSFFNDVRKKQKELGNLTDLQLAKSDCENKIESIKKEIQFVTQKKDVEEKNKDAIDEQVLQKTKTLLPIPNFVQGEIFDIETIEKNINEQNINVSNTENSIKDIEQWLSQNFKQTLAFEENMTQQQIEQALAKEREIFVKEKTEYSNISDWLSKNQKIQELNVFGFDQQIQNLSIEISNLNDELSISRGEKCPRCGSVLKNGDPNREMQCVEKIKTKNSELNYFKQQIEENNKIKESNSTYDNQALQFENIKNQLKARKLTIDNYVSRINTLQQSAGIILHNEQVDKNTSYLNGLKLSLEESKKFIDFYKNNLEKAKQYFEAQRFNKNINDEIQSLTEQSKNYKLIIFNLNQEYANKTADLKVEQNNLQNISSKFEEVSQAEKIYKKYSTYLQAVHRDGLPAQIIRKNLPIVNDKMNSILASIVDFKLEMQVLTNGDVVEYFYFNEDKSDMLSLETSGSGSQKFISSIVIQDALHSVSKLTKPSLKIIDEGFGTLDDELTSGIINILNYLRERYKHVLVVTHRNEVKDFMEYIIEIYKTKNSVESEQTQDPNAGISLININ